MGLIPDSHILPLLYYKRVQRMYYIALWVWGCLWQLGTWENTRYYRSTSEPYIDIGRRRSLYQAHKFSVIIHVSFLEYGHVTSGL